jgi:hypothetical protein
LTPIAPFRHRERPVHGRTFRPANPRVQSSIRVQKAVTASDGQRTRTPETSQNGPRPCPTVPSREALSLPHTLGCCTGHRDDADSGVNLYFYIARSTGKRERDDHPPLVDPHCIANLAEPGFDQRSNRRVDNGRGVRPKQARVNWDRTDGNLGNLKESACIVERHIARNSSLTYDVAARGFHDPAAAALAVGGAVFRALRRWSPQLPRSDVAVRDRTSAWCRKLIIGSNREEVEQTTR